MSSSDSNPREEPIQLPIEAELDVHTFRPSDIKELIPAYLEACRQKGILEVRIVHGKGIGNLRRTVHAILSRSPEVLSYSLATEQYGGWGATIVHLKALTPEHPTWEGGVPPPPDQPDSS